MRELLEKLSTEYGAPPLGQNIAKHDGKDKSGKKEKKMPNAEAGE
jgi:hypothetical protein